VVLSCDNLSGNGAKLKQAVVDFAAAGGETNLARWIDARALFPRTKFDSKTPATDDALRTRVAEAIGLEDAWPIQRERFTQWVVEDLGAPILAELAQAGVILTADVAGFEQAKLRLLNGAHSSLAYLGRLAGIETVSDAMAAPRLAGFIEALMREDLAASLTPPGGMDVGAYTDAVLERFRNRSIRHLLSQIAWDGSQKLPVRLFGAVAAAMDAGRPLDRLALPIAAWMRFVVSTARAGEALTDPLSAALLEIGRAASGVAGRDVPAFLALDMFAQGPCRAEPFAQALAAAYARLAGADPLAALG
jgi:fructuronate reductase